MRRMPRAGTLLMDCCAAAGGGNLGAVTGVFATAFLGTIPKFV